MTSETSSEQRAAKAPAESVAGIFDSVGLTYEKAYRQLPEQLAALDWLLPRLPDRARVLDIGSGTGRPTAEQLANAGCQVTGIDVSATMVELARRQVPAARFELADVRTFPGLNGEWDAICAFFPLLSMPRSELDATLVAIANGLAPGGYFLFATVPGDWEDAEMVWMGHQFTATSYPAETYLERLLTCGLEIAHHHLSIFRPDFPGMDDETQLFVYTRKPAALGAASGAG